MSVGARGFLSSLPLSEGAGAVSVDARRWSGVVRRLLQASRMHFDLEAFLARYQFLLMLAVLIPLLVLETYRPLAQGRRGRFVHGLRHVGLFSLGTAVFGFVVVLSNTLAAEGQYGLLLREALPGFVRVVLGLLVLDLAHYCRHLLMHKVPLLWRLHRVHHSDPELDVTSLFRVHPLENLSVFLCQLLAVALFGIPVLSLLLYAVLNTASAMFQHANLRMPAWADRWMSWVFTSPGMHHVHHSRHVEETDTNYAPVFAWWDRLFGTYRAPPEDRDIELGLAEFDAPQYQTFRGLMVTPFITPEAVRPAPPSALRVAREQGWSEAFLTAGASGSVRCQTGRGDASVEV